MAVDNIKKMENDSNQIECKSTEDLLLDMKGVALYGNYKQVAIEEIITRLVKTVGDQQKEIDALKTTVRSVNARTRRY